MADLSTTLQVIIGGEDKTKDAFASVSSSIQRLAEIAGASLIFDKLLHGAEDAVKQFGEMQASQAQTEAVIRSTGGAAGVTAAQVKDLATEYAGLTAFSDDTVQSAENLLLTFTNITSDIFPDATR